MKTKLAILVCLIAALTISTSCERSLKTDTAQPGAGETGASPATGPTPPENPIELSGAVIACEQTEDCVKVNIGCEGQCARWIAVNEAYADTAKERNTYICPDNYSEQCLQTAVDPICEDGECALTDATPAAPPTSTWNSCSEDDDCVIVELGCCDHCNGGRVVAANKDQKESVKADMGDDCSDNPICTMMACAPKLARCTDGTCEAYDDPAWGE